MIQRQPSLFKGTSRCRDEINFILYLAATHFLFNSRSRRNKNPNFEGQSKTNKILTTYFLVFLEDKILE